MKLCWLILLPLLALANAGQGEPAKKANPAATAEESAETDDESIDEGPDAKGAKRVAAVSTIEPEQLANFSHYAPQIQQLIRNALDLTKLNLTYAFGSSSPSDGGMDCSGTIVHLLQGLGMKGVPRQSDQICTWVQDRTLLHRISAAESLTDPEFSALQPGDLLFWSGTYGSAPRKIPVTHVMIYLGKLKKSGKHVVFGASDGRFYQGLRRTGVSVFDFSLPKAGGKSTLYGYGLIPGIGKVQIKPLDPVTVAVATVEKVVPAPPEPAKEPLGAKDGIAPLKTVAAATTKESAKEEIRRASPIATTTPKATATTKKSPSSKATTKPKPSPSPSKSRTSAQRRAPPPPPTAQQKFENAANRVANSIRNAFPN
ncbi:MAG: NlpC/P60 family protein [Prosthecobacter sp.]|nr:NlpC/P60 family protein [Prosthecobacter sp.]